MKHADVSSKVESYISKCHGYEWLSIKADLIDSLVVSCFDVISGRCEIG